MLSPLVIGKRVRCFAACDREMTFCEGEVIGYQEAPTLIVRLADGRQVHWRADLSELIAPEGKITHQECGCPIGQPCEGRVVLEPTFDEIRPRRPFGWGQAGSTF